MKDPELIKLLEMIIAKLEQLDTTIAPDEQNRTLTFNAVKKGQNMTDEIKKQFEEVNKKDD